MIGPVDCARGLSAVVRRPRHGVNLQTSPSTSSFSTAESPWLMQSSAQISSMGRERSFASSCARTDDKAGSHTSVSTQVSIYLASPGSARLTHLCRNRLHAKRRASSQAHRLSSVAQADTCLLRRQAAPAWPVPPHLRAVRVGGSLPPEAEAAWRAPPSGLPSSPRVPVPQGWSLARPAASSSRRTTVGMPQGGCVARRSSRRGWALRLRVAEEVGAASG